MHKLNSLIYLSGSQSIAELSETTLINSEEDIPGILMEAGLNDCNGIIIHQSSLPPSFFELKTRLAGEILQKFSNYRMKLAIVGNFSEIKSKSYNDFISECNRGRSIFFVSSVDEAVMRLNP